MECANNTETSDNTSDADPDATATQTADWLEQQVAEHGSSVLTTLLPYEVLGVSEFASFDTAKAAFRRLSRRFHPDKRQHSTEYAVEIFSAVRAALESMRDGEWRQRAQASPELRFFADHAIVELNHSAHAAALRSDGPLWLIIYFAPWWCVPACSPCASQHAWACEHVRLFGRWLAAWHAA